MWVHRAAVWGLAVLLATFGLVTLAALPAPEPEDAIHDGAPGLALFWVVGWLYAAAAVIQSEYGFVRSWRPTFREGFGVTWVGGWTLLVLIGAARQLTSRGIAGGADFIAASALMWTLLVGLPLALASMRRATRGTQSRDPTT